MDHPQPWLRYVDADALDSGTMKFRGFDVKNLAGDKLGEVNGFIFDAATADPYYIVVDSKGWFKTKHYLIPIGHARLDSTRAALVADLTQDQITKYPGFDLDEFQKWGEKDLDRFNRETVDACCFSAGVSTGATGVTSDRAQRWSAEHYRRPDWWDGTYYRPERAGEDGMPTETWGQRGATHADEPAMAHDWDNKN